uniref:Uncharacterized protein n=1 Tax=Chromera velia CCMP2878 TaxID=1169474 RepID=A0A0G4FQ91_9ALVE|eukprot:Cvel_3605.t1-p1 / transcript=Cvel_3605.t1 / gene=Cvel_3605 / organism=Chromera_velia_CCMP2878 / gene_product=hypothetical protein / transcript_product=hypothetical protein / location=Cvel_scaffold148:17951-18244(+) / protein_length=98 / sequence_SO=supercontig / SO=protein_coding / is_pseudo=false
MTRKKVRMAVTSCEAETNEAIRYGGGFVDMVFEQPPAWIQSLPIVEYSDAELEEDAPAVEGRTDTEETEGGQQGERRIFDMSNPADQEAWMACFANCM